MREVRGSTIVQVILGDQRSILTVCTPVGDVFGVCDVTISLPHLLGGSGILASLPLVLDQNEQAMLRASAQVICNAISDLAVEDGQVNQVGRDE